MGIYWVVALIVHTLIMLCIGRILFPRVSIRIVNNVNQPVDVAQQIADALVKSRVGSCR